MTWILETYFRETSDDGVNEYPSLEAAKDAAGVVMRSGGTVVQDDGSYRVYPPHRVDYLVIRQKKDGE